MEITANSLALIQVVMVAFAMCFLAPLLAEIFRETMERIG